MGAGWDKTLGPEDKLHIACITYLKVQFPKWMVVHVPSEGKRSEYEAWKAKTLGLTSGISDLLIFEPRQAEERFYCGLCIELKAGKNKVTPNQINFQSNLVEKGWQCHVAYTIDAVINIIQAYNKLRPIKF